MTAEQQLSFARAQGERWRHKLRQRINNERYRLIDRTELFTRDGVCALFNGTNLEVVYFSERLSELLTQLEGYSDMGDFQRVHDQISARLLPESADKPRIQLPQYWILLLKLSEHGFLRENGPDHLTPEPSPVQQNQFASITIKPTLDCNYRCDYCYHRDVPQDVKSAWVVTIEQVRRAFDCLMANTLVPLEADRSIRFTGGEPMLHYELVRDSLDYAAEIERRTPGLNPFKASMITNGSLVDEAWIELIKRYKLEIALSLDGKRSRNDRRRKSLNGSAYGATTAGLQRLVEAGIKPAILMTVSSNNIDNLSEDVIWLFEQFEPGGFSFNLDTSWIGDASWTRRYGVTPADYVQKIISAYDELSAHGLFDIKASRVHKQFQSKELTISGCAAVFSHLVVFPDGTIGPCPRCVDATERMEIVEDKPLRDSRLFQRWSGYSFMLNPTCQRCSYLNICEGWCPMLSLLLSRQPSQPNDYTCLFTKRLLEWIIWYDFRHDLEVLFAGQV